MTNREIKQAHKELCDIESMSSDEREQKEKLKDWMKKYGIHFITALAGRMAAWKDEMFETAHRFLQTETMVNTCNTAKWSSVWASVAATLSLLSVVAAWLTVYLTLKGYR